MPGILVSLLIAVLFLVLFQYVLDVIGLKDPAKKIIWIVAVIIAVLYVVDPGIIRLGR